MSTTNAPEANGAPAADRDSRGRFAAGNKGGPGNPFARKTAALRQALLDAVTPEDMQEIAQELVRRARRGHIPSAKLLLSYLIGKPAATPNPDHLDAEEWQLFKNTAGMFTEMPQLLTKPDPSLALDIIRTSRPAMTDELGSRMFRVLTDPDKEMARLQKEFAAARERPRPPLTDLLNRTGPQAPLAPSAPPSPNGSNGDANQGRSGKAARKNGKPNAPSANGKNGAGSNGVLLPPDEIALANLLHEKPKSPPSANGD